MARRKKSKLVKKIKALSNNFWILVLILLIGFFGGNYIKQKADEKKNIDNIKNNLNQGNQDNTWDDKDWNSNNNTGNNNGNLLKFWIDKLEVDFSLKEKANNIIAIVWEIKAWEAEKISVLTCRDNFSPEYDKNWYNLGSYKQGQEKFQFNTTPKFGNRCDIPYKFKFILDWKEKVFSFDAWFDKRNPASLSDAKKIVNYYWVENLTFEEVDKFTQKANIDDKQTCLNVLSSLDDKSSLDSLCGDADYVLFLKKLTDSLYEIKISENIFAGRVVLNRFFDIDYNKEIFKYDTRKENEKFSYKELDELFLSNLFSYNTKYWELLNKTKTVTADFSHYYFKENGMYFISDIPWNFRYWLKNITSDQISPNIKIKDNYIVILQKLDNNDDNINEKIKVFYWEIFPGRNSIDLDNFSIMAQSLWCGEILDHNMADYVDIVNKKIITKSSCSLELENPDFKLN